MPPSFWSDHFLVSRAEFWVIYYFVRFLGNGVSRKNPFKIYWHLIPPHHKIFRPSYGPNFGYLHTGWSLSSLLKTSFTVVTMTTKNMFISTYFQRKAQLHNVQFNEKKGHFDIKQNLRDIWFSFGFPKWNKKCLLFL